MSTRLVLVEDEDDIVDPLVAALARDGFEVERFRTAEDALEGFPGLDAELVILDVRLPGMSGFEACRHIRESSNVPVIMLTARASERDRIKGLETGADDYVAKPFSARELTARIRAILRRGRRTPPPIVLGDLEVHEAKHEVRMAGRTVPLTPREFDLLSYLAARSPDAVPRRELIEEVWDPHWHGPTKTLDVHVAALRRKLEPDPQQPRYLRTVRGVGYQVREP